MPPRERLAAPAPTAPRRRFVLVGGAGFVGRATSRVLREAGAEVVVIDRRPVPAALSDLGVDWVEADLLTDTVDLPDGEIVVLVGSSNPRPRWPWTLPLDIGITTARLLPRLTGRTVILISSIEIYGAASGPLTEETEPLLPWNPAEIRQWCVDASDAARQPCPPWRVAGLCRRMATADPSGRWVYGLAKRAQEVLLLDEHPTANLTVLRLANTFGLGQERVVSRFIRLALARRPLVATAGAMRSFIAVEEVGRVLLAEPGPGIFNIAGAVIAIEELANQICRLCHSSSSWITVEPSSSDNCGVVDTSRMRAASIQPASLLEVLPSFIERVRHSGDPLFDPPIPVVIPPRPAYPDVLADRQQSLLWSGMVKYGNRWTTELREQLRMTLALERDDLLLLTTSGTAALRLAVVATAGAARRGDVAVLPSFTYPATAEVLSQLGYRLRFVDVDPFSWTLSATAVATALAEEPAGIVVCVDTFGNPADYAPLRAVCTRAGIPLVADSAAGIGSRYQGRPLGTQADAHAFSMSFAKVLSAAGAGGAVVLRAGAVRHDYSQWLGSALMDEFHAVAALDQLPFLEELVERRAGIAGLYAHASDRFDDVAVQRVAPGNRHSYVHWVARMPNREEVARELSRRGVQTKPYFRALHRQLTGSGAERLAVSGALDADVLALPISSEMTVEDAELVVVALEHVLRRRSRTLGVHDPAILADAVEQ